MELGDLVTSALSSVGITHERVEKWIGQPCGCAERQEKLNRLSRWAKAALFGKKEEAGTQELIAEIDKPCPEKKKVYEPHNLGAAVPDDFRILGFDTKKNELHFQDVRLMTGRKRVVLGAAWHNFAVNALRVDHFAIDDLVRPNFTGQLEVAVEIHLANPPVVKRRRVVFTDGKPVGLI